MPTFRIETTAMVKRVYIVTAEDEDAAIAYIDENGSDVMTQEEEHDEDVDEIREIKPADAA